jgi:hypothetical protein
MFIRIQLVRESPRRDGRRRRPRPLLVALVAVAALAASAPFALGSLLSDRYSDVPATNPAHDSINRVVDAGIMTPCESSPGSRFCPFGNVIRMGTALQYDRLLGLDGNARPYTPTFRALNVETGGSGPPLTVDSQTKVENLNADTVDGHDSTEFLREVTVRSAEGTIPVNQTGAVQADCDPGYRATGGGGELVVGNFAQVNWIDTGVPVNDPPTGWRIRLRSPTTTSTTIRVWVVCIR